MTILINDNHVFNGLFTQATLLPNVNNIDEAMDLFGISPDQLNNENAIKSIYKKLALQYHPDVSSDPDATRNFQIVKDALDILEKYFGSYDPESGRLSPQTSTGGGHFNWKNDPLYKEMAEHTKNMDVDQIYQTHRNVEDNDKIKKMKAEIERIKNGEGGTWEEYKGSQIVFKVDLKDGTLLFINYGNSRSKNAYRNFLYQEFGQSVLQQFEETMSILNESFRDKIKEYTNSGMNKDEAIKQARSETYREFREADMFVKVPEDKLQTYRKKRITQIKYYMKKIQTNISTEQRSEEIYNNESPDSMVEMLSEEKPSVESGKNLFIQMQNLGIFKIPTRGRRKGLLTLDDKTIDSFRTNNNNPNASFAAGVGLLMRPYLDSTFNDRYISKFNTDPYVEPTAENLAGLNNINDPNIFSYPLDKDDLEKIQMDPDEANHITRSWKRKGMPTDPSLLLKNAQRGIYMYGYSDDPNVTEYQKESFQHFTKQFINDSPENLDYAERWTVAYKNKPLVEKNMRYYALQMSKALIQSGKSDINRHADIEVKLNEDDRSYAEKFNEAFSR